MLKKASRRMRLACLIIMALTVFLLLCLTAFGIFRVLTANSRAVGTVTFTYGVGSKRDRYLEGVESQYMPDGIPYVDFSRLASAYGFSMSGTSDEIRYIVKASNIEYDTVTLYYGSRKAIVNGLPITLSHPVKVYGNSVMVPAEFISSYMSGIAVEVTESSIRVIWQEGKVRIRPYLNPIPPIESN